MSDMTDTTKASPRHGQRDRWDWLLRVIITLTCLLTPLFFYELFRVTTGLLRPYLGEQAWIVPAAMEGAFTILFLLDLWLKHKCKPQGWLRWAPYPFAAASLFIQVWAARGVVPAMIGNAAVSAAFFLPLIAAERAVKSLAIPDADVREMQERADAMRYARDLMRDRKGSLWRYRVPSLLRVQILRDRPPAVVVAAVREGASFGGAAKWETAVETWIANGLTRGDKMAATVERQRAAIQETAQPPSATPEPRQTARQSGTPDRARARAKATRLLTANPAMPLAEVAEKSGVSERTASRIKSDLPVPLRVAEG